MRRAHEIVDGALGARAVVVGSLPPAGRDLDVVLRSAEDILPVERALRDAGFTRLGDGWLRFANMTAEVVELIRAPSYGLGAAAESELFAEAIVLRGCARLARPSPAHMILLIARRAAETGELTSKRRRRVEEALSADPLAWQHAAERSDGWGGPEVLDALDRLRLEPEGAAGRARAGLLPSGVRARLGAARDRARGRQRGAVIALSGLDGSGKSTQAQALRDALERLGYRVAIEWTRIGSNEHLGYVPVGANSALTRALMALARTGRQPWQADRVVADPATTIRQRGGALAYVWATVIALENLWWQRRRTGGFLARGYVVVCDRYTLDSIVALRCLLGERRRVGVQRAMLRAFVRRPAAAFLLEVAPETAWERKGEQGLRSLRRHHALYRREHTRLSVVRLDGERPPEELAARIAREVCATLARRLSSGAR